MSVVSSTFHGRGERRSVLGSWVGYEASSMVGDVAGESEKIHVSIKMRPLNEKEKAKNDVSDWECMPHRSMLPAAFTFDRVFGGLRHEASLRGSGEESRSLHRQRRQW
ncbi:unnamed protein product [Linum trigynum]|uniref:Kinesin motor domain-containing protein n=1 Tax=Linum trigynum TaxID=586398 RepID=A0AAV2CUT8_9ROSI